MSHAVGAMLSGISRITQLGIWTTKHSTAVIACMVLGAAVCLLGRLALGSVGFGVKGGQQQRLSRRAAINVLSACIFLHAGLGGAAASDSMTHGRSLATRSVDSSQGGTLVEQLIAALHDSAVDNIELQAGVYNLITDMNCSQPPPEMPAGLCIDRNVTIEATPPGAVVLHGMNERRVITVKAAYVTLIGLNITGGEAKVHSNGRAPSWNALPSHCPAPLGCLTDTS